MSILDGPRAVVVLELVEAGREPTNPAYGQATCVGCGNWVWLGSQTLPVVVAGEAEPLCQPCAARVIPSALQAVGWIEDR